ncbi:MAG: hypothetical protein WEB88_12445 [Gemmatimonadota bacterium]
MRILFLVLCAAGLLRPPAAAALERAGADVLRTPPPVQVALRTGGWRAAQPRLTDVVIVADRFAPLPPETRVLALAALGSGAGFLDGALFGAVVGIVPGALLGNRGGRAFDGAGFVAGYALLQGLFTAITVANR